MDNATGVLNKKKLAKCDITSDKQLEKRAGGYTAKNIHKQILQKITVVGWNDNHAVSLASNCLSSDPAKLVCPWNKLKESTFKSTNQTSYIQNIAKYRLEHE